MRKSSTIIFIAAGACAIGAVAVCRHDHAWSEAVRSWSFLGQKYDASWELLNGVRAMGKGDVLVCLALFAGALGLRSTAWRILAALLMVMMVVSPLKVAVGRERPNADAAVTSRFSRDCQSFPSGDTAATGACFAAIALWSSPWMMPAAAGAVAVGLMRVHDGAHYPSDVLAGLAIGFAAAGAAGLLQMRHFRRFNMIRPSWFAVIFVVYFIAFLVPCLIKHKGTFLDFTFLLGPTMVFVLLVKYLATLRAAAVFSRKKKEAESLDLIAPRESKLRLPGEKFNDAMMCALLAAFVLLGIAFVGLGFQDSAGMRLLVIGQGLFFSISGVWMLLERVTRKGNAMSSLAFIVVFALFLGVLSPVAKKRQEELREKMKDRAGFKTLNRVKTGCPFGKRGTSFRWITGDARPSAWLYRMRRSS